MAEKNLIHKFIAFLLVVTLAYVQTVLIHHQPHHTIQHSHTSSNDVDVSTFVIKCVVCDYVFTNRSESALLSSPLTLTFFSKTVETISIEKVIHIPSIFHDNHLNKGPPVI